MKKDIEDKLMGKGVKPTTMRILVYEVLQDQNVALSLSEIEHSFQAADRITIYRTLRTFEEKGVVHSIQENNTTRYKLCDEDWSSARHKDWHLHFYCRHCKQTTCRQEVRLSPDWETAVRIEDVRLFARGVCENCLTVD